MNYRIICKLLGLLIIVIGLCQIFSLFWSLYFEEWEAFNAFVKSIFISFIAGSLIAFYGWKTKEEVYRKEGMFIVGCGWLLAGIFGSLPFVLSSAFLEQTISGNIVHNGIFTQFVNSLFETISGLTTTGSTVFTDIEVIPKSLLFWRSFTHWIGGMGIIVLFIAVLPQLGAGGKRLFKSEVPGPIPEGLRPRIKTTSLILWGIYVGISFVLTVIFMFEDMNFFDALCHTFGTMATGGFSPYNASIGYYHSPLIEYTTVFFMLVAGINFGLYFQMIRHDYKTFWKDTELRVFLGVVIFCIGLLVFDTMKGKIYLSFMDALRYVSFQVASIITTTGYGTADFNEWPPLSKLVLVTLMFFGASSGSTGGGMKIIRLIILLKFAHFQIYKMFHPQAIITLKVGTKQINQDVIDGVNSLFIIGITVFVISSLYMAMLGLDIVTAATSVSATLWNIGPGLERVGSIENFAFIPNTGKLLLSLCMLMGRLEFFPILVIFLPSFWKN